MHVCLTFSFRDVNVTTDRDLMLFSVSQSLVNKNNDMEPTWRCYFDMRAEQLPSEIVFGSVLRVYKYPAYSMIGGGDVRTHGHYSTLRLDVFHSQRYDDL